jgi:hypothetical protein
MLFHSSSEHVHTISLSALTAIHLAWKNRFLILTVGVVALVPPRTPLLFILQSIDRLKVHVLEKFFLARTEAELITRGVNQQRAVCRGVLLKVIADPSDRALELHVLQRPFMTTHCCSLPPYFPGTFLG